MPTVPQTLDAELVTALVAEQFPRWSALRVSPVPRQGWDDRTFRLGEDLSVRLPSWATRTRGPSAGG